MPRPKRNVGKQDSSLSWLICELQRDSKFEAISKEVNDLLEGRYQRSKRRRVAKFKPNLQEIDEAPDAQDVETTTSTQRQNTRGRKNVLPSTENVASTSSTNHGHNTRSRKCKTVMSPIFPKGAVIKGRSQKKVVDEPANEASKPSGVPKTNIRSAAHNNNKVTFKLTETPNKLSSPSNQISNVALAPLVQGNIVNDHVDVGENRLLPADNDGNHCDNDDIGGGDTEVVSFLIDLDMFQSTPKGKPDNCDLPQNCPPVLETIIENSQATGSNCNRSQSGSRSQTKTILHPTNSAVMNEECVKENELAVEPVEQPKVVRMTRSKQKKQTKEMVNEEANNVQNLEEKEFTDGTPCLTVASNSKGVIDSKLLGSVKTPYLSEGNTNSTAKAKTPYKTDEVFKRVEKENVAIFKKQQMKMLTSEQVRLKREDKIKKANENKLAAEKRKAEQLLKMQKEKEEKERFAKAEREKQQQEIIMKKKLHNIKLQEVEERRKREEAAKMAKVKQQEIERKQQAALRLQQEKEAALLVQKQKEEEQKRKALEASLAKKTVPKSKPEKQARIINLTATVVTNIDISDEDEHFDDDEGNSQRVKRTYAAWTSKQYSKSKLEIQAQLGPKSLHSFFSSVNMNPQSRELFNESVVSSKHRLRSSSIYWSSPSPTKDSDE